MGKHSYAWIYSIPKFDVCIFVSRVGSATQIKAMKQVALRGGSYVFYFLNVHLWSKVASGGDFIRSLLFFRKRNFYSGLCISYAPNHSLLQSQPLAEWEWAFKKQSQQIKR
jgi:hypothetical protein